MRIKPEVEREGDADSRAEGGREPAVKGPVSYNFQCGRGGPDDKQSLSEAAFLGRTLPGLAEGWPSLLFSLTCSLPPLFSWLQRRMVSGKFEEQTSEVEGGGGEGERAWGGKVGEGSQKGLRPGSPPPWGLCLDPGLLPRPPAPPREAARGGQGKSRREAQQARGAGVPHVPAYSGSHRRKQ